LEKKKGRKGDRNLEFLDTPLPSHKKHSAEEPRIKQWWVKNGGEKAADKENSINTPKGPGFSWVALL